MLKTSCDPGAHRYELRCPHCRARACEKRCVTCRAEVEVRCSDCDAAAVVGPPDVAALMLGLELLRSGGRSGQAPHDAEPGSAAAALLESPRAVARALEMSSDLVAAALASAAVQFAGCCRVIRSDLMHAVAGTARLVDVRPPAFVVDLWARALACRGSVRGAAPDARRLARTIEILNPPIVIVGAVLREHRLGAGRHDIVSRPLQAMLFRDVLASAARALAAGALT